MTNTTQSEIPQPDAGLNILTPGERLLKQRQHLGMEQSSVAAQLHLTLPAIQALETDNYAALPGMTFAKGYLRSYARFLELPEEEIMQSFYKLFPETLPSDLKPRIKTVKGEINSSEGGMRIMTWGIVIGLGALLLAWWKDWINLNEIDMSATTEDQVIATNPDLLGSPPFTFEPASEAPEGMTQNSDAAPPPIVDVTVPIPVDQEQSTPVSESGVNSMDSIPTTVEAQAVESLPEETPVEQITSPAPAPETVQPVVEDTTPPVVVNPLERHLVFVFKGSCWTEVRDINGKALIIGELRSGQQREITVEPGPMKIVLGDATVVDLSIDGKTFDLSSHTRGKVARFTLNLEEL